MGSQNAAETAESPTLEERTERVRTTLHRRASLTEIMRKTLVFCETRRTMAEVEEEMAAYPEFKHIDQTQYHVVSHLVNAGGLERFELDREGAVVTEEMKEGLDEDGLDELVWSYALQTTDAGKAAADELEPRRRLAELINGVAGRKAAYLDILEFCREPRTYESVAALVRSKPTIASTNALSGLPVYPSALLAKLETAGGLVWDEGWRLTSAGASMLKALGRAS